MQNRQVVVSIPLELAKDVWTLIHDAKHPHHENKIVEQVKTNLGQFIAQSMNSHSVAAQQEVEQPEQADPEKKEEKVEEKVEEVKQDAA